MMTEIRIKSLVNDRKEWKGGERNADQSGSQCGRLSGNSGRKKKQVRTWLFPVVQQECVLATGNTEKPSNGRKGAKQNVRVDW